ncbi:MAG: transposon-transfer assisting family protein [Clostridia bacterium]|nr:transposon-transfer assisting family protein [Clostridia bacterium]MBQ9210158.1 transposon-transfer assisting family protein [Clostridia bacterium]
MTTFTMEEQNLICLYDPGSRSGLIYELREMRRELMPDEDDLEALTRSVLRKLERMTDEEYFEVTQALVPFYPLDNESYMDEDAAFGWSLSPDWDAMDPDTEIE